MTTRMTLLMLGLPAMAACSFDQPVSTVDPTGFFAGRSPHFRGAPLAAFSACAKSAERNDCNVETPNGSLHGHCHSLPNQNRLVCVTNDGINAS